jgi:hypothetical protein
MQVLLENLLCQMHSEKENAYFSTKVKRPEFFVSFVTSNVVLDILFSMLYVKYKIITFLKFII